MNNPEDASIANDNDDAGNQKSDNKESCFAAATVRVLQDGARPQLCVISENAC